MANRAAPFKQADVTRALKGAKAAGMKVRKVIATAHGVELEFDDGTKPKRSENTFDEVLDDE